MKTSIKALSAALVGGTLAAGCATGPYYGDPYYDGSYGAGYGYGYGSPYYYGQPAYVGPSVGFGYTYRDSDGDHRWRGHRREWRGDWRGSREEIRPGVDYTNEYERQTLENRARLLEGREPSGSGG